MSSDIWLLIIAPAEESWSVRGVYNQSELGKVWDEILSFCGLLWNKFMACNENWGMRGEEYWLKQQIFLGGLKRE